MKMLRYNFKYLLPRRGKYVEQRLWQIAQPESQKTQTDRIQT